MGDVKIGTSGFWIGAIVLALSIAVSACGSQGGSGTDPVAPRHRVAITVDGRGYHPAEARAPAGQRVRLAFTRTSDEGCGQQLVFPSLDIRRDLPLDQVVEVDVTMPATGAIAFTCGMNMYRGSVVAR